jgi:hypothetical protein
VVALVVGAAQAGEVVRLDAATRSLGDVTLEFPALVYRPPADGADLRATHAAAVSEATGIEIDPERDLFVEAQNRLLFRHPSERGVLLKIYKTSAARPEVIAKSIQREVALQRFIRSLGVEVAAIDEAEGLLERGVARQRLVEGQGLDALYPSGYQRGADPGIDDLLAKLETHDEAVMRIVGRQLGLTFRNAVDCSTRRSLGFDLGRCYGNVVVEQGSAHPVLIDW